MLHDAAERLGNMHQIGVTEPDTWRYPTQAPHLQLCAYIAVKGYCHRPSVIRKCPL